MSISAQKNDHISVNLDENVRSHISNGFEKYRLIHNALPEKSFASASTETIFLGKHITAPIFISSMTGGTDHGERINRSLTEVASELNIPFAIGSQRIYLSYFASPSQASIILSQISLTEVVTIGSPVTNP